MVTKIKCPKCEAVTDGAFCGMCGHRVQPPVISERNTEVSDFMPLAYVSAVPTLGSVFWMLGGEVFAPIGFALVGFGGLLITVVGALNIRVVSRRPELIALLILWSAASLPNFLVAMYAGNDLPVIARCSLWHLLVSSASILVRERLTAGSWVPTTKSAKILSIALAMQLLMALILVTVVYSRMIR